MNTSGILNLLISATAAGAVAFLTYFMAGGSFDKAGMSAAIAAAIASAVNHLRGTPNLGGNKP